jgi:hypothetical protein
MDKLSKNTLHTGFNSKIYNEKSMDKFNDTRNVRDYLKPLKTSDIKKYSENTSLGYCVLTLSICGNLNVGQLLGADKYIVFGKKSFDKRSAVGSMNYMNVERVFGLTDNSKDIKKDLTKLERYICPVKFHKYMIDNNLVPIFVEQHHKAIYLDKVKWKTKEKLLNNKKKYCFVFGNEGDGISNNLIKIGLTIEHSFVICIRQLGAMNSFNVSASVAIVLSEYKKYKIKQKLEHYHLEI